ncbi:M48 family metallopeptidase [Emticicia sp. 17c]|uniref:M48 family metallopeptidase n=1 Tax=Emticicia sp. 17c TaxID=3127704 RepID=UPI00301D94B3
MRTFLKSSITACLLISVIWACQKVPLTGRNQFVGLVSNEQMIQMSFAEYKGFMDTSKVVSTNNRDAEMIARVGGRIKTAVENYLIQNNYSEIINGYQWEFKLVQSKEMNAWCMPGGKVCFYTGILPVCKDEAGVAVVMGHEIAHAIASHGRERMSQAMAAQGITTLGAVGAGLYTGNQQTMEIVGQVLGVGTNLGYVLPNSRKQESEADKLGLIFMSMAGYDPQNAVAFWERMAEAGKNAQKPPKLLSTHPADEDRIADLKKQLPQAQKYYTSYAKK